MADYTITGTHPGPAAPAARPLHRPTAGNADSAGVFLYTQNGPILMSSSRISEARKVRFEGWRGHRWTPRINGVAGVAETDLQVLILGTA